MILTIRLTILGALAALFLAGCDRANIEPVATAGSDQLVKVSIPNCVLDVDPGKIKKCRPELGAGSVGIAGELQVDGIRPHRNWAPMVAIELASQDGTGILRFTFSIKEFKLDGDGKAIVQETPFTGVAERWTNRNQDWAQPLSVQIMPATPHQFRIWWDEDSSVNITAGSKSWKSAPLDFDIATVAITGSGVMVSTAGLSVLSPQ